MAWTGKKPSVKPGGSPGWSEDLRGHRGLWPSRHHRAGTVLWHSLLLGTAGLLIFFSQLLVRSYQIFSLLHEGKIFNGKPGTNGAAACPTALLVYAKSIYRWIMATFRLKYDVPFHLYIFCTFSFTAAQWLCQALGEEISRNTHAGSCAVKLLSWVSPIATSPCGWASHPIPG